MFLVIITAYTRPWGLQPGGSRSSGYAKKGRLRSLLKVEWSLEYLISAFETSRDLIINSKLFLFGRCFWGGEGVVVEAINTGCFSCGGV